MPIGVHAGVQIGSPELRAMRVGLAALPVQAVLAREVIVRVGGAEPGIAFVLSLWLLGSAAGGLLTGRRLGAAPSTIPSAGLAHRFLAGGFLAAIVAIVVARTVTLPGMVAGEHPGPVPIVFLGAMVLVLPAALTAGLLPLAAFGLGAGRAYAAESIGAAAGGLLASLAFGAGATPLEVLCLAGLTLLVSALPDRRSLACAAALLVLLMTGLVGRGDRALLGACWEKRHPGFRVAGVQWTPGRLLLRAGVEGQDWIFLDDEPREGIGDPYGNESLAALVASAAPRVGSVCLIGFTSPDMPVLLRRRGIARVASIAADRRDLPLAGATRGPDDRFGDPRFLFRGEAEDEGRFDVIALSVGDGACLAANRLITVEAFERFAARLGDEGTLLVIAPGAGAASTPESEGWRRSIAAALRIHLHEVVGHDGDRFVLAASRLGGHPLVADSLMARYRRGGIAFATYPAERFRTDYPPGRVVALSPSPPNKDARPAAFFFALGRWLRLLGAPPGALRVVRWAFAVLAGVAVTTLAVLRRRPQILLFGSGAAAMAASLTLLLAYQETVGLLQAGMGVLLGAFFAGTALGARLGAAAGRNRRRWIRAASPVTAIAAGIALSHPPAASAAGATGVFVAIATLLGAACGIWFAVAASKTSIRSAWAIDCIAGAAGGVAFTLWIDQGWTAIAGGVAAVLGGCALLARRL